MLKGKLHDFYALVDEARAEHGGNVPAITKAVIDAAFPDTVEAADREGCHAMLWHGVKDAVSRRVRSAQDDERQGDFAYLCETFAEHVRPLKSTAYTVPSLGEAVAVGKLIAFPELLDEARKFIRQKGVECLEEAKRLDDLYDQVVGA